MEKTIVIMTTEPSVSRSLMTITQGVKADVASEGEMLKIVLRRAVTVEGQSYDITIVRPIVDGNLNVSEDEVETILKTYSAAVSAISQRYDTDKHEPPKLTPDRITLSTDATKTDISISGNSKSISYQSFPLGQIPDGYSDIYISEQDAQSLSGQARMTVHDVMLQKVVKFIASKSPVLHTPFQGTPSIHTSVAPFASPTNTLVSSPTTQPSDAEEQIRNRPGKRHPFKSGTAAGKVFDWITYPLIRSVDGLVGLEKSCAMTFRAVKSTPGRLKKIGKVLLVALKALAYVALFFFVGALANITLGVSLVALIVFLLLHLPHLINRWSDYNYFLLPET